MQRTSRLLLLVSLLGLLDFSNSCSHREELVKREGNGHLARRAEPASYKPVPLNKYEKILLSSFDNVTIEGWSSYYTHGQHLAGKNRSQAEWTRQKFEEYGFKARLNSYDVLLSYPVKKSLTLHSSNGTYTPPLQEDSLEQDLTTMYEDRIPTFHGYSATGQVSAEYVYVGLGGKDEFDRLKELGVDLKGKIALAKYGGPYRGIKIKNAQESGMIGAVIFTDPGSDGNVTVANGYLAYPDGPARNPSSVQRGSVSFLSINPGDPTTPGYASLPGVERQDASNLFPRIPSLPISYKEVEPILQALDGHGLSAAAVNITGWKGGLNAEYNVGPVAGVKLDLMNEMYEEVTPIWDTIGVFNGTIQDEVIIIGNHRDAWIVGGAADPNSGSAVLIELAKAFSKLQKTGWKPKRTIVLASWDAEEYSLIGSVEFFEQYSGWARSSIVAYLNVDIAVSGSNFYIDVVPELHALATSVAHKVASPLGGTIADHWSGELGVLGSGSDFTAFVTNGIASLDVGFTDGANDAVYHYHSDYDSFHWMTTYGDPDWLYHKAMGQYLALMALELASAPLIPMTVTPFAEALAEYHTDLQAHLTSHAATALNIHSLSAAITSFGAAARALDAAAVRANKRGDAKAIRRINRRLQFFERPLAEQGGLPGREFFKHVVYCPGEYTGYTAVTFPGITEAVTAGNLTRAQEWVVKTSRGLRQAAGVLRGEY
ncbi:vacuolar protein sorting-associated protein 70 [Geopyxis carbonaria]|nr:vacuolar protein sorting-associated protein 70 [Geopyxis carbonaria]